jgi:PBP1b-binding outer membrane lipoprotein LpoB
MGFMKTLIFELAVVCSAVFFNGCVATESSVERAGFQIEQGLTGRGQIVPNNPMRDSFGSNYD